MTSYETALYVCAAIGAMLILLFIIARLFLKAASGPNLIPPSEPASRRTRIPCVLCGALLEKGEKLHSKEIVRKDDSIIHMYGCPHCHGANASRPKTCPVCKKPVPADGYLIGRMWIRKNGKKHLHIAGCTRCARM
jgi:hypothetical protein